MGWAIALVYGCVCMVGYCTSVQLGGVGFCSGVQLGMVGTSAQLGTRVELGLDECEGGLSWRQSPASVAKGPLFILAPPLSGLKEAHTRVKCCCGKQVDHSSRDNLV